MTLITIFHYFLCQSLIYHITSIIYYQFKFNFNQYNQLNFNLEYF